MSEIILASTKFEIKKIDKIMDKHLDNWMDNDIKTLAIKSSYGTGKTSLIKRILNKYKFKTILFWDWHFYCLFSSCR